jgi:hypothetical protein
MLVVFLIMALPKDRERHRVLRYGRRLRGPEQLTAAEFNRRNGSDGLGLITLERPTWTERILRRSGDSCGYRASRSAITSRSWATAAAARAYGQAGQLPRRGHRQHPGSGAERGWLSGQCRGERRHSQPDVADGDRSHGHSCADDFRIGLSRPVSQRFIHQQSGHLRGRRSVRQPVVENPAGYPVSIRHSQ